MNGTIFGIGPLEVIVVGVLVLLVFGPERLPEVTRSLGNGLRKLRETYVSFTQEFKGELQPIAQDIDAVTREIRQEVEAIREAADIRSILQPFTDDLNKAVKLQALPATPVKTESVAALSAASTNTIAPPRLASARANANGHGTYASQKALSYESPVELADDNPWASVGVEATIRTDKLDDDSPWRV